MWGTFLLFLRGSPLVVREESNPPQFTLRRGRKWESRVWWKLSLHSLRLEDNYSISRWANLVMSCPWWTGERHNVRTLSLMHSCSCVNLNFDPLDNHIADFYLMINSSVHSNIGINISDETNVVFDMRNYIV